MVYKKSQNCDANALLSTYNSILDYIKPEGFIDFTLI
jgi:hypothetical protein